ncbi:MAG: FAD-binding protein [Clostridia bacterium]|nr:FAD-binding protein [Clostridia bacterium]
MNIAVCIKPSNGEISPFDEAALECALRIGGDITVVSMCPRSNEDALKRLTRLGARAVLISDPSFAGSDTLATGYILSCAMRKLKPDLILCGRQSSDGDTAQVGPCLSAMLGMPVITNVMEMPSFDGNYAECKTRMGNEKAQLPCVLTAERIFRLRFPKLTSRAGSVEIWDNSVLGADLKRCGLNGSPTRVLKVFENKRGRRKCQFIERGELDSLIERLKNEPDKIKTEKKADKVKLKNVWTIGQVDGAEEIAESVTVIHEKDPFKIAELAEKEKPEVILWRADLEGRRNAPIAAALLNTGLCADCTELETDGENLFMYRPARSGSVTAKIKCVTRPQMATVRVTSEGGGIIIGAGRGVSAELDRIRAFADKTGAQLGASRGLVDDGGMPYEYQIGLTGKTAAPKIYAAIGISGAVHHTCAIENAEYIIAVNPDKNARIFEYADYGIADKF